MTYGASYSLSTSVARGRLSEIVTLVQDPRSTVILTRHGKPVAAVVSMAEVQRIWAQQDVEDIVKHGRKPSMFYFGRNGARTQHEAAEEIQKIQMDRKMEREVLANAGMEPVPGGEVMAEGDEEKRRWWERWFRRR